MSTDDVSSSSTIRRLWRTFSVSVRTSMPSSHLRAHDGTSVREPSTSTTQTRHALMGSMFGAQHSVGVSACAGVPSSCSASRIVAPSGTRTSRPSSCSVTRRLIVPSITGPLLRRSSAVRVGAAGSMTVGPTGDDGWVSPSVRSPGGGPSSRAVPIAAPPTASSAPSIVSSTGALEPPPGPAGPLPVVVMLRAPSRSGSRSQAGRAARAAAPT